MNFITLLPLPSVLPKLCSRLRYAIAADDVLAANKNCVGECTSSNSTAWIMQNKGLENSSTWRWRGRGSVDAEIIRKTMLLHEDIFRHQVRELHRLHAVQRMVMEELKVQTNKHSHHQHHQLLHLDHAAGSSTRGVDDEGYYGLDLTLAIGLGGGTTSTKHNSTRTGERTTAPP
ncbi:hypothetical protein Dimus_002412 [Dionaea muscipula]